MLHKFLLRSFIAVLVLSTAPTSADMAAAEGWLAEFQPSTLSEQQQRQELNWFVEAARPYRGMKIKVVSEVESGAISKDGARRKYGIGGKTTVLNWCRRYGTSHKKEYRILKVTRKEIEKQQSDKERIKELELALEEAHLQNRAHEIILNIMRDDHGIDIRKKFATKPRKK